MFAVEKFSVEEFVSFEESEKEPTTIKEVALVIFYKLSQAARLNLIENNEVPVKGVGDWRDYAAYVLAKRACRVYAQKQYRDFLAGKKAGYGFKGTKEHWYEVFKSQSHI